MLEVGFVQFEPLNSKPEENLATVAALIGETRFDVMVLPELFSTGYLFDGVSELQALAEAVPGGRCCRFLVDVARTKKALVIGGVAERDGANIYNTAVAATPDGITYKYRKTHLFFEEKRLFAPGDTGFGVFEWKGAKLGIMICFDWMFPEAARTLALAGADVICHPSNLVKPNCPDAMVTRSIENRVFTITANRIGTERKGERLLTFTGRSQIVSPEGEVLVRSGEGDVQVVTMEVDTALARNKYFTPHNHVFNDRRPELYKL